MAKPELSVSLNSPEDKDLILAWARSRGINRGSDLLRIALYEYIRRKLPKDAVTVASVRLRAIVDMTTEIKTEG